MKTSNPDFHEPAPLGFLASEYPAGPPADSRFHFWPVPLECSVSYGTGTKHGPAQILAASQQLEKWDGQGCPGDHGLFTGNACPVEGPVEHVLTAIAERLQWSWAHGAIPIMLGGEHAISIGAFQALRTRSEPVGVVQFDAHADLRDTYQGSPYSHACVMRRAHEYGLPISQWGVRALSVEEVDYRRAHNIHHVDAAQLAEPTGVDFALPADFPHDVYLTFDVDALDPAFMPATGTPEPGGLAWWPTLRWLQQLTAQRRIIGVDVVELAPIPGMHAPDYLVAKLIYAVCGLLAGD